MNRIISIQILRAVAALAVTTCHFTDLHLWLQGQRETPNPLYSLAAGVDLFFVISGFIMIYASETLFGQPGASRVFAARRVARIVPLYWVTTLLALIVMSPVYDAAMLLKSFIFIPFQMGNSVHPVYGVGWTLNYEMFFYALFAVAIITGRDRAATMLCAALAFIVALGLVFQTDIVLLKIWSDPIVLEFAAGMMIAVAYRRGVVLTIPIRLLLAAIGATSIWWFAPHMPPSGNRILTWGLPMAIVVAAAALGPFPTFRPAIARALNALGDASFSLYLLHSLVGGIAFRIKAAGYFHNTHLGVYMTTVFIITLVLSLLTYSLFERPVTRLLQSLMTAKTSKPQEVV